MSCAPSSRPAALWGRTRSRSGTSTCDASQSMSPTRSAVMRMLPGFSGLPWTTQVCGPARRAHAARHRAGHHHQTVGEVPPVRRRDRHRHRQPFTVQVVHQVGLPREIRVAARPQTGDGEVPVDAHPPHVVGDATGKWFDARDVSAPPARAPPIPPPHPRGLARACPVEPGHPHRLERIRPPSYDDVHEEKGRSPWTRQRTAKRGPSAQSERSGRHVTRRSMTTGARSKHRSRCSTRTGRTHCSD